MEQLGYGGDLNDLERERECGCSAYKCVYIYIHYHIIYIQIIYKYHIYCMFVCFGSWTFVDIRWEFLEFGM